MRSMLARKLAARGSSAEERIGTEAEVSAVICFLLSPGAAFVTGITVPIDGGAPLGSPVFPMGDYSASAAFEGFHRAETPAVLKGE